MRRVSFDQTMEGFDVLASTLSRTGVVLNKKHVGILVVPTNKQFSWNVTASLNVGRRRAPPPIIMSHSRA